MATLLNNITPLMSSEEEIAWCVTDIRQMVEEMEALEERISDHKARLRVLLTSRGENWTDDLGYARICADFKRTSYNTKALDEKIIKNPRKFAWLKRFRKEFSVKGGVQVK